MVIDQNTVLHDFLHNQLGLNDAKCVPLQNDASLRKFYRINTMPTTILMDARLDTKNKEFIENALLLKSYGLRTPEIFYADIAAGLFHVEDFGDHLLINNSATSNIRCYLQKAIDVIQTLQSIPVSKISTPIYFDQDFILRELNLFKHWYIGRYLELQLRITEEQLLDDTLTFITQHLLSQPYVCMHRDYHSKNLMLLPDETIGLLDFQDLMIGPITYDVVSLLKDCYVTWNDNLVADMLNYFYQNNHHSLNFNSKEAFIFYFDITGLQRHLKVLGGFSKIYLERGNSFYLQYFDRILDYIVQVAAKYPQFDEFYQLLIGTILPRLFKA